MWLSVVQSLQISSQAFSTIGVIEYRDPQKIKINTSLDYDYSPIILSEYVQSFDYRGLLAGFSKSINTSMVSKHRLSNSFSIIEFTPLDIDRNSNVIQGEILKVHYSNASLIASSVNEGDVISIEIDPDIPQVESGKRYLTSVWPRRDCFSIAPVGTDLKLIEDCLGVKESTQVIMEVTNDFSLESGYGLVWAHLIKSFKESIHSATVYATGDLESMKIFHQGKSLVTNGRSFSQEDYQKGNRVCLISTSLGKANGLQLGDLIPLSFSEDRIRVANSISHADYFNHLDSMGEAYFEIIGFYQEKEKNSGAYSLYEDTVFIPLNSISYQPYVTRDNLVSFRLTNGKVEAFLEEMEQHDLPGLNFTFYDQGYSKVSGALAGMKETALLLTGICAAAGLGIILLFSLLFVGRQKRNIAIMYSLGTSRGKALAFLLITVLMVSGLAVTIGGIAGYTLSDRVLEEVYARNSEEITLGTAYSEVYGEDNEVNFQAITPEKPIAPLTAAGTVLVVTLIMSGIFAAKVLRAEPMQVLTEKEE